MGQTVLMLVSRHNVKFLSYKRSTRFGYISYSEYSISHPQLLLGLSLLKDFIEMVSSRAYIETLFFILRGAEES
jgi:hypothetical protein